MRHNNKHIMYFVWLKQRGFKEKALGFLKAGIVFFQNAK